MLTLLAYAASLLALLALFTLLASLTSCVNGQWGPRAGIILPLLPLFTMKNKGKTGANYGVFRVTPRDAGSAHGGRFGCWQAACCFHKLAATSGCKRNFPIEAPTSEAKNTALKRALLWSLMHNMFERQRDHLDCPVPDSELPSIEWFREREVTERPPRGSVLTDAQLDAGEAPPPPPPPPAAKAKPKAEPKAKAKATAKASCSRDSGSSSSSTDSSSSSRSDSS